MKKIILILVCFGVSLSGFSQTVESVFSAAYGNYLLTGRYVFQAKKNARKEYILGLGSLIPGIKSNNNVAYARNLHPTKPWQYLVPEFEIRKYYKRLSNSERFKFFSFFEQRFYFTDGLDSKNYVFIPSRNRYELVPVVVPVRVISLENSLGIGCKFQINSKMDFISKLGGCVSLFYTDKTNVIEPIDYDIFYNFSFGLRYRFN